MGNGHDGGGVFNFVYRYLYIPAAVIYMPIAITEHLWHWLSFFDVLWGTLAVLALGAAALTKREYLASHGKLPGRWVWTERAGVGLLLVGLAVITGWLTYERFRTPVLTWERVSLRSPAKSGDETDDLGSLQNVIKGLVREESLLKTRDRDELIRLRQDSEYQDQAGHLKGVHYVIYESSVAPRAPDVVSVKDDLKALVGLYVVGGTRAPEERLDSIGEEIKVPHQHGHRSKCRLVLVVFPLNEEASDKLSGSSFGPGEFLNIKW